MTQSDLNLPEDVATLQSMVIELKTKLDHQDGELKNLYEQLRLLRHNIYSSKSERYLPDDAYSQSSLFADAESGAEAADENVEKVEEISVPGHKRKKRGRKRLDSSLPRIEIEHDLSESEKKCGCGHKKSRIGSEKSEQLEIKPAQVWVISNIRYKYACQHCEGVDRNEGEPSVQIAPPPPQLIPKSISSPSLLAHLFSGKFEDALPFYRQEKQFARYGVRLSRGTMCNWAVKVSALCVDMMEHLRTHILSGPLIQVDETTVQVLHEPNRSADTLSRMWVFLGGPPGKKAVYFHYSQTRSGTVASDFIGDYQGCVQSDGYSGYNFLDKREGIFHAGCWAHVRRKFYDVIKPLGKNRKGVGKADKALLMIKDLYKIEREAKEKNLTPEELYEVRQKDSRPKVNEFYDWLESNALQVAGSGSLSQAFSYALSQKERLKKFLDNSVLSMDNNLAENAIRPFVVGRKNWMFSDQPHGAEASAVLYSIIETAKANNLEPYHYLLYLFDKLPDTIWADDDEELKKLLPYNVTANMLDDYKKEYFRKRGPNLD